MLDVSSPRDRRTARNFLFPKSTGSVRRLLIISLALVTAISLHGTVAAADPAVRSVAVAAVQPNFGPNVLIFDPSMSTAQIEAAVGAISAKQIDNEMGTARYSLLFKPGTYGSPTDPLMLQIGYYTEVAGLGLSPTDVTINGHVDVFNRCITADNCIALNNFWRSISNLTINVTNAASMTDCRKGAGESWAVSQ